MKSFTSTLATTLMILLFPNNPPPPFKNIQIFGHPPRYFIVFFGLASLILFSAPLPFLMIEEKILKAVLLNLRPTGIDSMFGK